MAATPAVVDADDLDRRQITFADGEDGRVYVHPSFDLPLPSVTTIIDERENAEKDDSIAGWQDYFDGSTQRQSPHHADQLAYKAARGTLGHYAILSKLDDSLERTAEEDDAEHLLKNWATERPTVADDDIDCTAPFGDPGAYEGEQAWSKCMRDINWTLKRFEEVANEHGINPDSVLTTEQYVFDTEYNYAGQFDLCYEDENGETVLADLKLSSGTRIDYKVQLAAYDSAFDRDIDRYQILRFHPDKQVVDIQDDGDWDRTVEGLRHEFLALADICHSRKTRPFSQSRLDEILAED